MFLRKNFVALAAVIASAAGLHQASASTVTLTCTGNSNGQTVHATNTVQLNIQLLCTDKKKGAYSNMSGGMIFHANGSCTNSGGQDVNIETNPSGPSGIPTPPGGPSGSNGSPDVNNPFCDNNDQGNNGSHTPWNQNNPDCPTGPTPPSGSFGSAAAPTSTPLPESMWAAGAMMAALGVTRRIKQTRTA